MTDKYASLHRTVRVAADGTVAHGMPVPHTTTSRALAGAPRVVHGRRFAPNLMPAGVDLNTTIQHDCRNHLRDFETPRDAADRIMLDMPVAVSA